MQNNLKEQIYDRVERWYKQRIGISRLQENISKALDQDVPLDLIREIITEIKDWKKQSKELNDVIIEETKELERKNGWLKALVNDVWDDKLYDYNSETDQIIFYPPNGKPHAIIRTTVLAMFEKYSKDWENLSGKQMQQQFQLTPKVRQFIKRVMDLYKDSVPFDKVTLSQIAWEDMDAIAAKKAEQLTEAKMRRSYDTAISSLKERKLKEYAKSNKWYDILMDKLERVIKTYQPREFDDKKYKILEIKNNDTKSIFFWDAHLWKKWTDGIVIRIKKMTRELIESPEKNIDITFLWDIWECFLPFPNSMHPDQRLGMEEISTEDLIMLAVDVLEQMMLALYRAWKIITFNGVGGNHWRLTERKEFDPHRSAEMIIYRFLEKIVEKVNIKVNILRENMNIIKQWNIKAVILHWDDLSPAKLQRIALQELEDNYFLVIISADKHHLKIIEISDRITWIQTPSLSWKWRFDENLALSSLSWYIELKKNSDWLLNIEVKRLK